MVNSKNNNSSKFKEDNGMVWVFGTDSFCDKGVDRETDSLSRVNENDEMWLRFSDDCIVQVFCTDNFLIRKQIEKLIAF